jgi:hypothetical protein
LTTAVFRWAGQYWGFLGDGVLYDRYGRQVGWREGADVFRLDGRFLGEVVDAHYVMRDRLREQPIHRAPRPGMRWPAPPLAAPDRAARDSLDDWADALPWPLPPPDPPAV